MNFDAWISEVDRMVNTCVVSIQEKVAKDGVPLDGDEVDYLCDRLHVELDLVNGNITQAEYDKIIDTLERP